MTTSQQQTQMVEILSPADQQALEELTHALTEDEETIATSSSPGLSPALAVGAGVFCLMNVGVLLSLPPVLRGRGAPYLPTFQKSADTMFEQLRKEPHFRRKLGRYGHGATTTVTSKSPLRFVDLGSGDGRVVFRAAREGIFETSAGYEINPFLHLWASTRRLVQSRYRASTEFHLRDIWKVDLGNVDVVAVYGLSPIMQDLGVKLMKELQPGTVVLSNVFAIPGWKQSPTSAGNVHIYSVPSCWRNDDHRQK